MKKTRKEILEEKKVKAIIRDIIKENFDDLGMQHTPVEEPIIEQGGMPTDGYEFADGMNKAIKGKLDTKKCQEMQSLLWKSTTDSMGDEDKETLRNYWLTIFDDEVEAKFIGKPWYPFDDSEITDANAQKDIDAAPDVDEDGGETEDFIDTERIVKPEGGADESEEEITDEEDEEIT